VGDFQAKVAAGGFHGGMRALFAGTVRVARDTRLVQAIAAQLVEQREAECALCRNRCA